MAINKKIITMLVLVMAVGTITATYAASTSFIGEDCQVFTEEFNKKACNDINNLHLFNSRSEHFKYHFMLRTLMRSVRNWQRN